MLHSLYIFATLNTIVFETFIFQINFIVKIHGIRRFRMQKEMQTF